jgi:hypothetical protein
MNMCRSGAGHPKGPIGGLKGGSLGKFPLCELPPSESLGCPPSNGRWSKSLGMWIGKLVITCIVVSTNTVTCC